MSMTVLTSVPLIPIMLLLCLSLIRWLNQDFGAMAKQRQLAQTAEQLNANNDSSRDD
jgi:choline-glycine betaine transporter